MSTLPTRMICILTAAALAVFSAAALCGCDKGDMEHYLDGEGYDAAPAPDSASLALPGSDILPDGIVGTWYPTGIYQYAVASDISDAEALEYERQYCLAMSYTAFSRYTDDIATAVYKVNEKASYDDMLAQGIQVDPLTEKYGEYAEITSVRVFDGDGAYCTTVFLIGGETLIGYGAGMNVFSYERLDAEG